jgi:hypothetical protein
MNHGLSLSDGWGFEGISVSCGDDFISGEEGISSLNLKETNS